MARHNVCFIYIGCVRLKSGLLKLLFVADRCVYVFYECCCLINFKIMDIEDPITYIKERTFSSLSLEEKLNLKNSQKRPDLNISQKDGKTIRKFQKSWYESFSWLTGSVSSMNALYCFPCVLFGGEEAWAKDGISVIKNFVQKANKHASSKKHISCNEFFCMLGKVRIDHTLIEARKINALQHNEKVRKNRQIVGRLIDVVCFLAKQELAFRGHHETAESKNKGRLL